MRKSMKQILSLVLALAMILSLGIVPAMAEGEEEIDIAAEPAKEIDESAFPAQQFSYYEQNGLNIDVQAPAGALPRGTTMEVSRLTDLSRVQNAVDRAADIEGSAVLAADISFWNDGVEIEPADGSKILVTMTAPEIADVMDPVVVHVPDEDPAVAERIDPLPNDDLDKLMMADQIAFEASDFSVYAVIGDNTGNEARVTVNFYNLSKQAAPIVTVYVKNSDVLLAEGAEREPGKSYINDIVYDPGVGETLESGYLFKGWSLDVSSLTNKPADAADYVGSAYVAETEGLTIPEIRSFLADLDIKEGDVLNVYAMIYKVFNVTYEDAKEIILASDIVLLPYGQTATSADYKIDHSYEVTGHTQHFEGWNVKEGGDNISDASAEAPYPMGTTMKISGDVKFSTEVSVGNWLVFEENHYGATYNAPIFIKSDEVSRQPSLEMVCKGYTFGGWYKLKEGQTLTNDDKDEDGNYIIGDKFESFTFGSPLTDYTILYAKWTSAETATYTVIVWKQSVVDDKDAADADKTYDYAFSKQITDSANKAVSALDLSEYTGLDGNDSYELDGKEYDFTGFKYNAAQQKSNYTTVHPDGTTVINLYYDRELVTYTFNVLTLKEVTPKPTGSAMNNGEYYIKYNNQDCVIRYRRNNWGTNQYYIYSPTTSNSGTQYAYINGTWTELTYRYSSSYGGYAWYYDDGNYYYRYSGIRYVQTSNNFTDLDSYTVYSYQWEARDPIFTGLYGQKLSKYGYTWPLDYRWMLEDSSNPGTPSSTSFSSIEEMFLGSTNYYGRTEEFNATVSHFLQNVDGTWPDTATYTVATNTTSYMSFKSFAGFKTNQFRIKIADGRTNYWYGHYSDFNNSYPHSTDANGWTDWLDPGNSVKGQNGYDSVFNPPSDSTWHATEGGIEFRYTREQYDLTYMVGRFVDRNDASLTPPVTGTLKTVEDIPYETNLAAYAEGGASWFEPAAQTGFVFAGWYIDETCTTPVDFANTTMPMNGLIVYAKWQQIEYRVFLKPNAGTDPTLFWGKDDQAMNFRISYNGKVSLPTGQRTGYEFGGWFTDEEFNHPFNENTRLTDTTVPETPEYDKTKDWTDGMNGDTEVAMNKWGNIPSDATPINKDVNRFWITRKLVLYAHWGKTFEGADGIGVLYDPNGGSNEPHDTLQYKDNIRAVAQAASTAPSADLTFDCWVMQQWDEAQGEYVDIEGSRIYPGDTFVVLLDNARKVANDDNTPEHPSYTYTIQLRANYVSKEAPLPTYITWYSNVYDSAGNLITDAQAKTQVKNPSTEEMPYEALAFNANNGYGFKRTGVQINKGIEIPAPDTFTVNGYRFLGWGRVDIQQTGAKAGSGVTDPSQLTADDLFLKWVPDNSTAGGHYEAKDPSKRDGEWVTVTQVAADEDNPYQDLYAIWVGEFYVYHTGTNVVERVEIAKKFNNDFSLTALVDTNTYLYGGYYAGYANASSGFVANAASLNYVAADAAASTTGYTSVAAVDSALAGHVAYATDSGTPYDGVPTIKVGEDTVDVFTDAYTAHGNAITPVAGTVYYIKEVLATDFLQPRLRYTYVAATGEIGTSWLFTNTDTDYSETGFIINNGKKEGADATSFVITALTTNKTQTFYIGAAPDGAENPVELFKKGTQFSWLLVYNNPELYDDGRPNVPGAVDTLSGNAEMVMYWVTPDGMIVTSTALRNYSNVTNAYSLSGGPRTVASTIRAVEP